MAYSSIRRSQLSPIGTASGDVVARGVNGSIDVPTGGAYTINGNSIITDSTLTINQDTAPSAVSGKAVVFFDSADSSLKVKVSNGDVYALVTQKQ